MRVALLAAVLLSGALATPFSFVRPAAGKEAAPLRLAIFHPFPRLCQGQEPGPRERRVLRLAYWVARPGGRERLPWFYRPTPGGEPPLPRRGSAPPAPQGFALRPEALWGRGENKPDPSGSEPSGPVGQAAAPGRGGPAPLDLAEWRARILASVPALGAVGSPTRFGFEVKLPGSAPFLFSRMASTGLLPFFSGEEDPHGSAGSGGPPAGCRDWPQGVDYRKETGKLRYRLSRRAGGHGPPFRLSGYRNLKVLLKELRGGGLDAVLLEGPELETATEGRLRPPDGVVAVFGGTQQVLLRVTPRARAALGREGVALLSTALSRRALADAAGAGFAPAKAFLEPLLPARPSPGENPLRWDSLGARKGWLKKARPEASLRFGVLAHPLLERVARGIASQWKRTLNLSANVMPLPVESFQLALADGKLDLALDVADLDDGSLQHLWATALTEQGGLTGSRGERPSLAELEGRLRAMLPFLPVLANRHFLLARNPRAFRATAVLCGGCKARRYGAFGSKR